MTDSTFTWEPTRYVIQVVPEDHYLRERYDDMYIYFVAVELRDTDRWCVTDGFSVYDAGLMQYGVGEPIPSSRSDEFKQRYRFDLATAKLIGEELARDKLRWLEEKWPR